jgi:uncharacterized protein YjbI with pentapeptide repeats
MIALPITLVSLIVWAMVQLRHYRSESEVTPTVLQRDRPEARDLITSIRFATAINHGVESWSPRQCDAFPALHSAPLTNGQWTWQAGGDARVYRREDLERILRAHESAIAAGIAERVRLRQAPELLTIPSGGIKFGRWSHIENADVSGRDLRLAWLPEAIIRYGDWSKTNFGDAILPFTIFDHTKLDGAYFGGAELSYSDFPCASLHRAVFIRWRITRSSQWALDGASLRHANFWKAKLTSAIFGGSDLSGASFDDTDLTGADFHGADLRDVVWEPATQPKPDGIASAKHLDTLRYRRNPRPLIALRQRLRESGFTNAAAEVNAALLWRTSSILEKVAFGITCGFGSRPSRAFAWLLVLTLAAAALYAVALLYGTGPSLRAARIAITLSVMTGLSLGFRDFTLRDWAKVLQPREFDLRATGPVRILTGLQALASLYLIVLGLLSLFANPFLG